MFAALGGINDLHELIAETKRLSMARHRWGEREKGGERGGLGG
jgi:hypothetical protein